MWPHINKYKYIKKFYEGTWILVWKEGAYAYIPG